MVYDQKWTIFPEFGQIFYKQSYGDFFADFSAAIMNKGSGIQWCKILCQGIPDY